MKRVGLFISVFFLFLIGVLFVPSLRQSVFACSWTVTAYTQTCAGNCGTGEVCTTKGQQLCECVQDTCLSSCSFDKCGVCGCTSSNCEGGNCRETCCTTVNQQYCPYGCTPSASGGTCNSAPPATNTPAPKYSCDKTTGYCEETTSGYSSYSSCQSLCVKNTPIPTATPACRKVNGVCTGGCPAGQGCVAYVFDCFCLDGRATPTPGGDTCSGTNGSCNTKNCLNGKVCSYAQGSQYCGCYDPTPTPPKYSCNRTTGGCIFDANGTQSLSTCQSLCVQNTSTPVPCKTSGASCGVSGDCCSNLCIRGICAAPTSTPAPNCSSKGGSCVYSSCSYASNNLCAVSGGTCNAGFACCTACSPTNTQPPPPPTSPTAIPSPLASCAPEEATTCIGNDLYHCQNYNPTTQIWQFSNNCLFSCSATNPYANKCGIIGGVAQCCTSTTDQYCGINCDGTCPDGQAKYGCAQDASDYVDGVWTEHLNPLLTPMDPQYPYCIDTTHCGCVTLWERCGGTTLQSTCDAQSPGSVPKYDNCSRNFCGSPCGPTPTPDGLGGGGDCTPSCDAAPNYCLGDGFDDGCGGTCFGTESCTGTINAKAVLVNASDRSCTALATAATLNGTVLIVDGVLKTQTAGATLTWADKAAGQYTISGAPPGQYATANTCVSQNSGAYIQGISGTLTTNGTVSFLVGYMPQSGWVQTVGGNVYTGNQLVSSIPTSATNPYFSLAGAMGDAGMVTYGTSYDFSLISTDLGENSVSTKRWLMQHTNTSVDYYTQFATRMDIPGSATTIENRTNVTKPTCSTSPCVFYANGDMTTAAGVPWTIGATEQMIVFVNGNVTINSPITIASGGFFALISHNGIFVNSTVGGTTGSTTPTLEGIYITTNAGHTALFATGNSNTAGRERLIVRGSVIADNFQLFRDLGTTINGTTPAEQFIFNPQLLFTMPDVMKEIPYVWQEVAP